MSICLDHYIRVRMPETDMSNTYMSYICSFSSVTWIDLPVLYMTETYAT